MSFALMRPIFPACIAVAAAVSVQKADACPVYDYTYIKSGGGLLAEIVEPEWHEVQQVRMLPSHPSVYVHPGVDSDNRMPTFTHLDGSKVPVRRIDAVESSEREYPWLRVDLDVEAGVVLARTEEHDLPDIYIVSPAFTPKTRSVERDPKEPGCLAIDSDAAMFRLDRPSGASEFQPAWRCVWLDDAGPVRVVAIYPDRRSEAVFHRRAESDASDWALALLPLACLIARRRSGSLLVV